MPPPMPSIPAMVPAVMPRRLNSAISDKTMDMGFRTLDRVRPINTIRDGLGNFRAASGLGNLSAGKRRRHIIEVA